MPPATEGGSIMTGNREYKSDVFSMLMEDRQNALELYNAMNNSNYSDASQVEICRLDGGISLSVRNDAAFILDMRLSIYEHQSTMCPNMPLRSFIYLANILHKMIKNRNIYGRTLVKIPTPKFAIFYNGEEEQPEQYELKLSDAFESPVEEPEVELRCKVYNINYGKNKELMNKCTFLKKYMIFVEYVRTYHKQDDYENLEHAIERAIDRCIEEDVLRDFLMEHRSEVVKVMTLDYTFERQLALEREERLAEGYVEGHAEGRAEGHSEGILYNLIQLAYKKYLKGYTIEETAELLEEDYGRIKKIYDIIMKQKTDNIGEICEHFMKEE